MFHLIATIRITNNAFTFREEPRTSGWQDACWSVIGLGATKLSLLFQISLAMY